MAFLFIGGEDTDFLPFAQTWSADQSAGTFRSGYARLAMASGLSAELTNPLGQGFTPAAQFWLTFRCMTKQGSNGQTLLALYDGAKQRLGLRVNTDLSLSLVAVSDGGTATALVSSAANVITDGALQKFDLSVSFGSSGSLTLYVDGTQVATYTGDLTAGSSSTALGAFALFAVGKYRSYLSEIIVASGDTRTMSLVTHAPTAAGTTNQWIGTYADIDETQANGSDVIFTSNAAQIASFDVNSLPQGAFAVRAVKVTAAGTHGESGPTQVQLGLRVDGTNTFAPAQALDTGWTRVNTIFETNPVTGAPFTMDEVNAMEIAVQSQS